MAGDLGQMLREFVSVELLVQIGRGHTNRGLERHQRAGLTTPDPIISRYLLINNEKDVTVDGDQETDGLITRASTVANARLSRVGEVWRNPPIVRVPGVFYSQRSAIIGSTFVARRAGR